MTAIVSATYIAAALGVKPRRTRQRSEAEGWKFSGKGAHGVKLYPLAGLPNDVQAAISARRNRQELLAGGAPSAQPAVAAEQQPLVTARPERKPFTEQEIETLATLYEAKTEKAKNRAKRALAMVQRYYALVDEGAKCGAASAAVCAEFNVCHATLSRHVAEVKNNPPQAWLYILQDKYPPERPKIQVNPHAMEVLKADYFRVERPCLTTSLGLLRRMEAEHQWNLPSNRTLDRRIKEVPRQVSVLARQGKEAADQLYPPQARNKAALCALAIINGDGYKHNLWIEFPDGEIIRAKTWFWQDVYSSKVIGWRTDKTEHTDVIRLSFGDVVEQYGIPEAALLDNTLAAANKTMSGGIKHRFRFNVKEEEPLGVFPLLGCRVMWAIPRHGQSKPVERVFGVGGIGEIIDKAPDFAGAWTGANPMDKPDYDGKTRAIPIAELLAVIAREVAAWNTKLGRRSVIHAGRSCDEVFAESYEVAPIRRATDAQRRLWLLATEPVRANAKDGSITLDAGRIVRSKVMPTQANRYWAPALVDYAGRQVAARFDPARLHEGVHVYSLDGRYIAFAECHAPQGFNDANAGREHNRARNNFTRATKQLLASEVRMDALQVAKHLPGVEHTAADLSIPSPKVVRGKFRELLDRPTERPVTEAKRADMAAFEATFAQPRRVAISKLYTNDQKVERWAEINERINAGETVDVEEQRFWDAFQRSDYFLSKQKAEAKFEEWLTARKA